MTYSVRSGSLSWRGEAESMDDAARLAFSQHSGTVAQVTEVRVFDEKGKKQGPARYAWTTALLEKLGLRVSA